MKGGRKTFSGWKRDLELNSDNEWQALKGSIYNRLYDSNLSKEKSLSHKSSELYSAFTLIELLVVIAIVALLLAILMPTLQRIRRQAKAVVCMSNLRQWGPLLSMYTDDNDGRLFTGGADIYDIFSEKCLWYNQMYSYWCNSKDIFLCPVTSRSIPSDGNSRTGTTFQAWYFFYNSVIGSYGHNYWAIDDRYSLREDVDNKCWRTCRIRQANTVPILFDCTRPIGGLYNPCWEPPVFEDQSDRENYDEVDCMINRHDGCINMLFMDWSVRRIGIKELWTLKWHRNYDTAGPWTKAGGVTYEDWPQWMRTLKDY